MQYFLKGGRKKGGNGEKGKEGAGRKGWGKRRVKRSIRVRRDRK